MRNLLKALKGYYKNWLQGEIKICADYEKSRLRTLESRNSYLMFQTIKFRF
jgi:hypothetical protein